MPAAGKSSRTAVARMCAAEWRSTSSGVGIPLGEDRDARVGVDRADRDPALAVRPGRPAPPRARPGPIDSATVAPVVPDGTSRTLPSGRVSRIVRSLVGSPGRRRGPPARLSRRADRSRARRRARRAPRRAASGPARAPEFRAFIGHVTALVKSRNHAFASVEAVNLTRTSTSLHEEWRVERERRARAALKSWPGPVGVGAGPRGRVARRRVARAGSTGAASAGRSRRLRRPARRSGALGRLRRLRPSMRHPRRSARSRALGTRGGPGLARSGRAARLGADRGRARPRGTRGARRPRHRAASSTASWSTARTTTATAEAPRPTDQSA